MKIIALFLLALIAMLYGCAGEAATEPIIVPLDIGPCPAIALDRFPCGPYLQQGLCGWSNPDDVDGRYKYAPWDCYTVDGFMCITPKECSDLILGVPKK